MNDEVRNWLIERYLDIRSPKHRLPTVVLDAVITELYEYGYSVGALLLHELQYERHTHIIKLNRQKQKAELETKMYFDKKGDLK